MQENSVYAVCSVPDFSGVRSDQLEGRQDKKGRSHQKRGECRHRGTGSRCGRQAAARARRVMSVVLRRPGAGDRYGARGDRTHRPISSVRGRLRDIPRSRRVQRAHTTHTKEGDQDNGDDDPFRHIDAKIPEKPKAGKCALPSPVRIPETRKGPDCRQILFLAGMIAGTLNR